MTEYRRVSLRLRNGLLEVLVDGSAVVRGAVFWDSNRVFYSAGRTVGYRTQFGQLGESDRSYWRSVSYVGDMPGQSHLVGTYITMEDLKPAISTPLGAVER